MEGGGIVDGDEMEGGGKEVSMARMLKAIARTV